MQRSKNILVVVDEKTENRVVVERAVTLPVKTLLSQFQRQRQQIAIVLDEYGGTQGLVTLEDILEEVVGEVRDEFDVDEEEPLTLVKPGHLVVQGIVHLDEVEAYVSLGQPEHDVQTVGGLAWALLGRRPEVRDEVAIGNVTFRVDAMAGLTITQVSLFFPPGNPRAGPMSEHACDLHQAQLLWYFAVSSA
jgi:putative hemolysin